MAVRKENQILFWLGALVLFVLAIGLLRDILLPFVAGVIIAYFLNPVAERLSAWGVPRIWSSAFLVVAGGVVIVALLVFLVPLLIGAGAAGLVAAAGGTGARPRGCRAMGARLARHAFSRLQAGARPGGRVADSRTGPPSPASPPSRLEPRPGAGQLHLAAADHAAGRVLPAGRLAPDAGKIDGWLPRDHAPTIRRLAGEINDAVAAFIRGQGAICLVLGVFYATA